MSHAADWYNQYAIKFAKTTLPIFKQLSLPKKHFYILYASGNNAAEVYCALKELEILWIKAFHACILFHMFRFVNLLNNV